MSRLFSTALALALSLPLPASANSDHGEPPAAAPQKAPEPPPPPPPPPRPRIPPPVLNGPIAAPEPKPRMTWIADPYTGLAIGGYDVISYFLESRPRVGSRDFQLDWDGATWQFANEGDRDAFRADPRVYAPLFGGRCVFAIANGHPAEGSPGHFLVWKNKLLLFADAVSRAAFLQDPDRLLAEAERRWPGILADLP